MAVPNNAKVVSAGLNEPGVPIQLTDGSGQTAYPRMMIPVAADGTPMGGSGAASDQVQGNVAHDAVDSGNPVGIGAYATNGFQTAVGVGDRVRLAANLNGLLGVSLGQTGSFAGSNAGITVMTGVTMGGSQGPLATANMQYNGSNYIYDQIPNLNARLLSSAATTNATSVKASMGQIFRIQGNNTVASKRYLKLYNKASAPTVGTDVPVMTIVLLASAGFDFSIPKGYYFPLGIAFAITGAIADADTTAIGAGDIEAFNMMYA